MLKFLVRSLFTAVLLSTICFNLYAQNSSVTTPVRITFDEKAKRVDLLTDMEIPAYQYARKGSIRFYLWNIHEPQDYLTYLHDGVRKAPLTNIMSMEKVQPQFSVWILSFGKEQRNSPRIRELAVSFIPLVLKGSGSQKRYKVENRVYILLDDLKFIDWNATQ